MPDIQTLAQYREYQKSVAKFIKREKIHFLSTSTAETYDGEETDPWFGGHPCECCQSSLAGNREYLYARYKIDDSIVRFEICEDCVYYLEYGRLDDTTMARIEKP